MSDSGATKRRATYQDVLDAPERKIAEIVDGELFLTSLLGWPHIRVLSTLNGLIGSAFYLGRGGPGGWIIVFRPEIHLGDDGLVPDIAGWRRERMPNDNDDDPYFTLAPDWVCEVLSASTEGLDRTRKLGAYARAGVPYAWLVHPLWKSIEQLQLRRGMWATTAIHLDNKHVRIEPFDAIELDMSLLWRDVGRPGPGCIKMEPTVPPEYR